MKNLISLLLFTSLAFNNSPAQDENQVTQDYSQLSSETIQIIDEAVGSEKDSGAVILLREAKMTVGEGGLYKISYHIIGQLFDEKAKDDYSQIPVSFNSYYEKLTLDFARTIDKDKSFIEVSKDAVQIKTIPDYYGKNTYTDSKILAFSLPALKPGKFFEYQVTSQTILPVVNNYWFESFYLNLVLYSLGDPYFLRIDPVKLSRFILALPEIESFQSEIINAEMIEDKVVENGVAVYTWEMANLPIIIPEIGMPYLYEAIPMITVSSIPDWKAYGSWVYSVISQSVSGSSEIKMKASELTSKALTKNEKIKLLYDYVREEIDYIQADLERGGLKPHSADEVLRTKYGDCKDQVVLFLSLLQAVNIESYPALINTYSYREHQKFIPTQYFDHLIVYVPSDSIDFWLDTTTDLNEFPTLYSGDQNRWALVTDKQNVTFIKTPSAASEDNAGIFNLNMKAHNDSLSGIIEIKSFGVFKDFYYSLLEYYSKSDLDKYLKELFESYFYQVAKVKDINSVKGLISEGDHSLIISFDYLQPTNEYILFQYSSSITLAFTYFSIVLPLEEERQFDYVFPFKFTLKGCELLKAPWNYSTIKNCPVTDSVVNKYFSFKQIFQEFRDSVHVKWEFTLNENFIPKEDYTSFNSDVLKVEEMISWQIDFQKQLGYEDIETNLSSYFGINMDSTLKSKDFIPPHYINDLYIDSEVKKEIVAVIEGYILALNDGDEEVALELLYKDNPERKYVKRYSDRDYNSLGISLQVENINLLDVVYDYAIVTYTTLMDLKKYPEIGQIRFEYLSILNKLDHHWKIYRSRIKEYIDNCMLYSTIAYNYYKNDEYDKALVIFDLAMANDSACTYAFGNTGWIYYLRGNYQKCIEFSRKAVELDSTALYAQYNMALSYLCLGEFDKAKLKYEKTIQLNAELDVDIHQGAIEDLQNLIKKNFKKVEAEQILTELFEMKDINKSLPAEAK